MLVCSIGALGLYLFRFHLAHEKISFETNKNWFDTKLLVEQKSIDNKTGISDQSYAKTMKRVFKDLGLVSNHFVHAGRSIGPRLAETLEVDPILIKQLGNWNQDTQEKVL